MVVLGLGGNVGFDVPWLWLVPIAFVGLLDAERVPAVMLGAAAVLGVLSVHTLATSRPAIDWHNLVVLRLESDDLVLAATDDHAVELSGLRVDCVSIESIREDGEEGTTPCAMALDCAARSPTLIKASAGD
jgi:hypothetical protein